MRTVRITLFLGIFSSFLNAADDDRMPMIFAHGLADTHKQAYLWQDAHPFFHEGPIIAQNFPDATERFWRVNFPLTSLGQDNEIATYKETVETFQQKYPGKKTILCGLSRGAATVINYTALHQPDDVAALILISPFPSMKHVAQHIVKNSWLKDVPYAHVISPHLVGCVFWQYSNSGVHPIDVITQIDPNIPILFISLEHDHLVPSDLTQILVDELIENGHTRVHHLSLSDGRHGKPIPGKEGKKMQLVIQAFLHYYRLPCDARFARKGMIDFAPTCPSMYSLLKTA